MSEVTAVVEAENIPPIQWPERVILFCAPEDGFRALAVGNPNFNMEEWCRVHNELGTIYKILRVQPPQPEKRREVVIDFNAVVDEMTKCGQLDAVDAINTHGRLRDAIERHATIREVNA